MASISVTNQDPEKADIVYKTKIIHFLGRSVPIILQNDNGPCPLLAICNVLLLRNNLSLGLEISEVASSRLLALVAERLIDSNSNIEGKNEEYARNQQQNISDALALLHHLVTGLDVNVRFRNIHDFEFTSECAVFDLLDIGLVHGWLCDPQDEVTTKILEPHSYNTLVEKLIQLQAMKTNLHTAASEDTVDFAAATTATLGVPSPSRAVLLKTKSFENPFANSFDENLSRSRDVESETSHSLHKGDSESFENPFADSFGEDLPKSRGVESVTSHSLHKGDSEENAQLQEALKLSSQEMLSDAARKTIPTDSDGIMKSNLESEHSGPRNAEETSCSLADDADLRAFQHSATTPESNECNELELGGAHDRIVPAESSSDSDDDEIKVNESQQDSTTSRTNSLLPVFDDDVLTTFPADSQTDNIEFQLRVNSEEGAGLSKEEDVTQVATIDCHDLPDSKPDVISVQESESVSGPMVFNRDLDTSSNTFSASSEPLYEGEAEIAGGASAFEAREPLYEGEANLPECAGQIGAEEEGAIISCFLKTNATQLTYYGLFCLQEGLKERELCVFFRNNHFSTMFKYKGDLYLLVTDQGYLTQPEIAWEKLDEVHGDTVFVTGTFIPFQGGESSSVWDEQGAIAATADYISSHQQGSTKAVKQFDANHSDFDLAVSLQQEEFEQQQQQHQQQQQVQSKTASSAFARPSQMSDSIIKTDGKLLTGPKKSSYSYKPESKSKCEIM